MTYLLDVNVLLAGIWTNHPQHDEAFAWLSGKSVALCPLAELGFLREPPVTILRNQFEGCGSFFRLISVMATPSVVGFIVLTL